MTDRQTIVSDQQKNKRRTKKKNDWVRPKRARSQVYLVTRVEEEDKDERSEDKNYEDNNGDYLGREGQTEI